MRLFSLDPLPQEQCPPVQGHQQPLPFPHVQVIFHPSQPLNKVLQAQPQDQATTLSSSPHQGQGSCFSTGSDSTLLLGCLWCCGLLALVVILLFVPRNNVVNTEEENCSLQRNPTPRAHVEFITKDKTQPAQLSHHTTISLG